MAIETFHRYEKKYRLFGPQAADIAAFLNARMEPDFFCRSRGFYEILNLYYDTPDHWFIRTSIEKPRYKEKLRMRHYMGHEDTLYLEIKKKVNGLVNKRRTPMDRDVAAAFLSSNLLPDYTPPMNRQVLREIETIWNKHPLSPVVVISYRRKAWRLPQHNRLRVTMDWDIAARRQMLSLERSTADRPVFEKGTYILEVKVPDRIPVWLSKQLSELQIFSAPISKYRTEYQRQLMNMGEEVDTHAFYPQPVGANP